ncbi:hypothetical protein E3Q03_03076 [Wallemia mellicola]|uniref:F-box domain-containing protein n=1 Tax=Wallemia mellicola TaxID=1708541 RepID=A0AB74KBP6_9BASI|nr:hypothetical protein E3Q03_03076 [Wallemia mellicola]
MDVFDTSTDITDGQHTTINRDIPTSIYSLPVEILDKIICLEPQIAFTCRSLYHIGFRWLNNTVVGPRYELYGLCRLVYRENTYMLIDSFNRHLSNMTKIERHRFALRTLCVNMNNIRSGRRHILFNKLAANLKSFPNLTQVNIVLSSLYHILSIKHVVFDKLTTLVLECRSVYLEGGEPQEVVDLLVNCTPNLRHFIIYAGNEFQESIQPLLHNLSQRMKEFEKLESGVVLYRKWSTVGFASTMLRLVEYECHGQIKRRESTLQPTAKVSQESTVIAAILERMSITKKSLIAGITIGYE